MGVGWLHNSNLVHLPTPLSHLFVARQPFALASRQAGAMKPRLWRYVLSVLLACILLSNPQHPRVANALFLPQLLLGKRGTMKAHPQHLLDCMNDAYEPHGTTWASAMGDKPGASEQLHGGLPQPSL